MRMMVDLERDRTARIETQLQVAARIHLLYSPELTIRHVPLPGRRRELHAVAFRELAVRLSIQRDPLQAARIIRGPLAVLTCDR